MSAEEQNGDRVGVLGGTFDPVHFGHLAVADHVFSELALDRIIFIPAARPPHKPDLEITPFIHRAAMLELALENRIEFVVSKMEEKRSGPSYSIDTLKELRDGLRENDDKIFFLIGMDAFGEIDTWKDFRSLPSLCDLVVIDRPDHAADTLERTIARFPSYKYSGEDDCWISSKVPGRIHPITMEPIDISSTRIREMVRAGESIDSLVPTIVACYIMENSLYS